MSKSPKSIEIDDEEKTWEIDHHGIITVDVHKLMRSPKVRGQIAKAREIMERIRDEQAAGRVEQAAGQ